MIDRQLIGDVGLAVLLAFPTMALARPQPFKAHTAAAAPLLEKAAIADRTPVEERYGLPA